MEEHTTPFIVLKDIVKTFPGVKALNGVSFDLYPGEVHAICGENGAGKSTLIKVMTGAYVMDSGTYLIDGKPAALKTTQDAIDKGVACVYQELFTAPQMTVMENIYMGQLPRRAGIIDYRKLRHDTQEILNELGLDVSPDDIAGELPIGKRQLLEIGRALAKNAKVVILDEPTSSLSEAETDILFEIVHRLTSKNVAVIYISHKLDEVMYLADRITVIRDGENIITKSKQETTSEELIRSMVGREVEDIYHKSYPALGDTVLEVRNLSGSIFKNISFSVKSGEVLGFFGLVGAGRSEIMRAVFGIDRKKSGEILVNGVPLSPVTPGNAIRHGIGFLTEDRKADGLLLTLSVETNMTIAHLSKMSRFGFIRDKLLKEKSNRYIESLSIKTPGLTQQVCNLSGGNQQKVILAKWLMNEPKVLIVDEPTRGIDVGAKAQIYELLDNLAKQGIAIIVVSSEIEEILGVCDRVITVCEGRTTADIILTPDVTSETVLSAALNVNGATGWRNPPPRKEVRERGEPDERENN